MGVQVRWKGRPGDRMMTLFLLASVFDPTSFFGAEKGESRNSRNALRAAKMAALHSLFHQDGYVHNDVSDWD